MKIPLIIIIFFIGLYIIQNSSSAFVDESVKSNCDSIKNVNILIKSMLADKDFHSVKQAITNGFMDLSDTYLNYNGDTITLVQKDSAYIVKGGVIDFNRFILLNDTTDVYIDATYYREYKKQALSKLSYRYILDCENSKWILKDSTRIIY